MNDSMSKILLVDDEEDLTDLVRYHLETESFAVDSQIEGKDLRVLVEDNGIGIPDGDLPRIF
ncbi:MAG: hypothetical protein O7C75_05070, partial [Verrucomicrobia bacterium]|nr:hypothetical protein [Verrucomicrobiota bacterium]